jgi:phosphoribosylaminoimidazole-succinocarboxamide synthase
MEKKEFLYEGKAKKVWTTDDPSVYVVEYKNSLTAFNALKKDTIEGKGRLNNLISSVLFGTWGKGVPTILSRGRRSSALVKKVSSSPSKSLEDSPPESSANAWS